MAATCDVFSPMNTEPAARPIAHLAGILHYSLAGVMLGEESGNLSTGGNGMSDPVIKDVRLALIEAPLREPIVAPFGTLTVSRNLLVLVELAGGASASARCGRTFRPGDAGSGSRSCATSCARCFAVKRWTIRGGSIESCLRGCDRSPISSAHRGRFIRPLAGADIALWDARARWMDMPLADLLRGARGAARAPVYATNLPSSRGPKWSKRWRPRGTRVSNSGCRR